MVGFSKSLFLRTDIPNELLCRCCEEVLRDPVTCLNCALFFCASCSEDKCKHNHHCTHTYTEANKFIKNKIEELYMKCENHQHGCVKVGKVTEMAEHQKSCEFIKSGHLNCGNPACDAEFTSKHIRQHISTCPFYVVQCDRGCRKQMKIFEREDHDCVDWLKNLAENFEVKYNIQKNETETARSELAREREERRKEVQAFEEEKKRLLSEKENLQNLIKKMKADHEEEVRILKEQSAAKMRVFYESSEARVASYLKKAEEEYRRFAQKVKEEMSTCMGSLKGGVNSFSNNVQRDAESIKNLQNEAGNILISRGLGLKNSSPNKSFLTYSTNTPTKNFETPQKNESGKKVAKSLANTFSPMNTK